MNSHHDIIVLHRVINFHETWICLCFGRKHYFELPPSSKTVTWRPPEKNECRIVDEKSSHSHSPIKKGRKHVVGWNNKFLINYIGVLLIPLAHLFLFSAHQRGQVTTFKCTFRDGWHQFWLLYILRINEGFGIFWDVFLVAPKCVLTCFALNKTFLRQFCMTNKKHQKTSQIMYIKVYESPWSKFSLQIQEISNRTHWTDP